MLDGRHFSNWKMLRHLRSVLFLEQVQLKGHSGKKPEPKVLSTSHDSNHKNKFHTTQGREGAVCLYNASILFQLHSPGPTRLTARRFSCPLLEKASTFKR